jgi:hypothetical protein
LTLFQLLLILALIAILIGLMLPAVQKVREAAARQQSLNNIKQLMLGIHNYASVYDNALPLNNDANHFSTSAYLLPYIEQDPVFKKIDFKKSVNDEANAEARKLVIKTFLSPLDEVMQVKTDYGATNYLYNDQVLNAKPKYNIGTVPDGTSNTIFIGETLKGDGGTKPVTVKRQHVLLDEKALKGIKPDAGVADWKDNKHIAGDRCASWMDGRFLQGSFNGQLQPNDSKPDVSCGGAGGVSALRSNLRVVNVGLGDGSVRAVTAAAISETTWRNAMCPDDGQALGADW